MKLFCEDCFAKLPHGEEKRGDHAGRDVVFKPGPGEICSFCEEPTEAKYYAEHLPDAPAPVLLERDASDEAPVEGEPSPAKKAKRK